MSTTSKDDLVSDELMKRYSDLVYSRTGIRLSEQKKILLSNRVRRRLRATGIASFDAYFSHLKKLSQTDEEWDRFLQEITTHETYLFRDELHWKWFRETFLPERLTAARKDGKARRLRIWSAAASTGDEAFTIASCIAGGISNLSQWKIEILGTDIGIGALEEARESTFNERSMRLVPEDLQRRFFAKAADVNVWKAKPVLCDMITFQHHNLMDSLKVEPFDLVLVKNVLIYFDPKSKQQVLTQVGPLIRPGAYFIAGAAEGVSDMMKEYERIQPWLYRKPTSP